MLNKNTQVALQKGELLPLMEAFYSLQGEGFYKGTAAYFIRLGGCDVGCHWCDVKESWTAEAHPLVPVDTIVTDALALSKTMIITGGTLDVEFTSPYRKTESRRGAHSYRNFRGSSAVRYFWLDMPLS